MPVFFVRIPLFCFLVGDLIFESILGEFPG